MLHPVVHAAEDDVSIWKEHVLPELSQASDPAPSSGEVSERVNMLQIASPGTQGFLSCLIIDNCSDFGMKCITIIHVVSGYLSFVKHFEHMEILFVNGNVLEAGLGGQVDGEDIEGHCSEASDILRSHSDKCREDADLMALRMSVKDHVGAIGVKPWLAHSREMNADMGGQFVKDGPKGGKTQNHFGTSATVGIDQGLLGTIVAQVLAADSCRYLDACRFRRSCIICVAASVRLSFSLEIFVKIEPYVQQCRTSLWAGAESTFLSSGLEKQDAERT
jgi:hypothetical protein